MSGNGRSPLLICSLFSLQLRLENFGRASGDQLRMPETWVVHLDLLLLSSAALTCAHYLINISPTRCGITSKITNKPKEGCRGGNREGVVGSDDVGLFGEI